MAESTTVEAPAARTNGVSIIWDVLKDKGALFIVMAVVTYYFYLEVQQLKDEVKTCNGNIVQLLREDRIKQLDVINNNTQALERFVRQDQIRTLTQ